MWRELFEHYLKRIEQGELIDCYLDGVLLPSRQRLFSFTELSPNGLNTPPWFKDLEFEAEDKSP